MHTTFISYKHIVEYVEFVISYTYIYICTDIHKSIDIIFKYTHIHIDNQHIYIINTYHYHICMYITIFMYICICVCEIGMADTDSCWCALENLVMSFASHDNFDGPCLYLNPWWKFACLLMLRFWSDSSFTLPSGNLT